MPTFKTVIIGCGNIAGGYDADADPGDWPLTHAGAFSVHDGFEIVACCDPDTKKRRAFQERWNIPVGAAHPEELGTCTFAADVVSLCSPTALHPQHLKTVLGWQPKLLFCEKPVAPQADDVAFWVSKYEEVGVPFVVNHNRRWAPDICALKEELAKKEWGKVHSVSATYNKGILNNGSHMVDLFHYLLGPVSVVAVGSEVFDFWPDDPSVPALLETHDGIPITLNIAHAQDYAFFEVQFVTEQGVLCMESGGMSWSKRVIVDSSDFPGYRTLGESKTIGGSYRKAMLLAVDNIHKALTNRIEISSIGATALQAQRICQQIRQCAQTKSF